MTILKRIPAFPTCCSCFRSRAHGTVHTPHKNCLVRIEIKIFNVVQSEYPNPSPTERQRYTELCGVTTRVHSVQPRYSINPLSPNRFSAFTICFASVPMPCLRYQFVPTTHHTHESSPLFHPCSDARKFRTHTE